MKNSENLLYGKKRRSFLKTDILFEEISQKMGVSLGTVVSYLYTKVDEGKIRHSDIFFTSRKI